MHLQKLLTVFQQNTYELDIALTRTVNILTNNELVKLKMFWTTGPWNFIYSISMKISGPVFFHFFCWDLLCKAGPLFGLRHLTRDGGYLLCATLHSALYQWIWNIADSFSYMVCRYAYDFGIFDNLIFFFHFFLTSEPSHFWGVKYYLNALLRVPCVCNSSYSFIPVSVNLCRPFFHGLYMCMWILHYCQFNFCHFFRLTNLAIFVRLSIMLCILSGVFRAWILKFCI